jgi:hypothetical protein
MLMALAAFLLVPNTPLLQSLAPITDTPLLLVSALGVCAILGWGIGGRVWKVLVWVGLTVAILVWGGVPRNTYVALQYGWALVLVASFGLVCTASPPTTRFLARALTALAASVALVGVLALGTRDATSAVGRAIRVNVDARPNAALAWVEQTASSPEWQTWTTRSSEGGTLATAEQTLDGVLATLPHDAVAFYPALLGLESLAALALAWSFYHRTSRTRIGEPLGRLADFRFSDQLAWGLIAGATLVLLPTPGDWRTLGLNLLLFFGALYAIRGLAVVVWYLQAAHVSVPAIAALALVAGLLSAPSAIGLGLIGLSDSWVDWRSRARPPTPRPMG